MRPQDLTGQRFGRLTVLSRAEDYISPAGKRTTRWLCRCDCGTEKIMLRNVIKRAGSCGCVRREKAAMLARDLGGQRFGRWTVIKRASLPHPDSTGAKTGWLCKCSCGTGRILPARYLTSGASTSCGCQTTEKAAKRIIPTGQNVLGRYDGTVVSKLSKTAPTASSKTGVRGVYWSASDQRYIAKIGLRNKSIYLGRFKTLEKAAAARKEAEDRYYAPIITAWEMSQDET